MTQDAREVRSLEGPESVVMKSWRGKKPLYRPRLLAGPN